MPVISTLRLRVLIGTNGEIFKRGREIFIGTVRLPTVQGPGWLARRMEVTANI